jgi:ABC-type uncharacterized transport system permease subunit
MSVLAGAIEGSVTMAVPLLFAALGETVVQKSGVVNVGIEGLILTGALAAVLGAGQSHNPYIGLACAAITAGIFALLFALFAVRLAANQVVVGVVINLMALGITGTISRFAFGAQHTFVSVIGFEHGVGNQTLLTPVSALCVPAIWWWLHRTRWGLRAVLFGGVLAGVAGTCLTLGDTPTFQEGMSAGRGFIALAIVTAGRWSPYGCIAASLVFAVSEELEINGQAMGLNVPHDILLAAPYIMTLLILMFGGRAVKAPAALGLPFRRS